MIDIWKNRLWCPMLLNEISEPFNSDEYLFELKFDGIRGIIFVSPTDIYIKSRNNVDMTNVYPELKEICKLVKSNVIFDGEIVSFSDGKSDFGKLQKRGRLKNSIKIKNESIRDPVVFVCFDILYEDVDLTDLSLTNRKKILNKYNDNDVFIKSKVYDNGIGLFNMVKKNGLEGIVAKNKCGKYHINERTSDFIKIKNIKRDIYIIGGFIEKNDNVCSLLLGEYINNKFCYVGKVIMGKKQRLYAKLCNMKKSKNYFVNCNLDANYIKPEIKCHIEYLEKTKNGSLRHPVYKGEL